MSVNLSPVGGAGAQFCDNNGNPLNGGKLYTYSAGTTTPAATYTSAAGSVFHTNPIILNAGGRVPDSGEIWLSDNISYKFVLKTSADVLIATWDNINGINSNFVNYTIQEEVITATAGQTVFNLSTITYAPATNSLAVYVDGVNQIVTDSYIETDANTVTFVSGLHVGALVKFTTAVPATGTATNASLVTYDPSGTGAVSTTVQTKLRESVSVKDFGAVGDGVTDDTTAIQAALNSGVKNVFLDDGDYFLANATMTALPFNGLTAPSGVRFYGSSGARLLLDASGSYAHVLVVGQLATDVIFENITIDGQGAYANGIVMSGLGGGANSNCHAIRCKVIDIHSARTPSTNRFTVNQGGAAYIMELNGDGTVTDCSAVNCQFGIRYAPAASQRCNYTVTNFYAEECEGILNTTPSNFDNRDYAKTATYNKIMPSQLVMNGVVFKNCGKSTDQMTQFSWVWKDSSAEAGGRATGNYYPWAGPAATGTVTGTYAGLNWMPATYSASDPDWNQASTYSAGDRVKITNNGNLSALFCFGRVGGVTISHVRGWNDHYTGAYPRIGAIFRGIMRGVSIKDVQVDVSTAAFFSFGASPSSTYDMQPFMISQYVNSEDVFNLGNTSSIADANMPWNGTWNTSFGASIVVDYQFNQQFVTLRNNQVRAIAVNAYVTDNLRITAPAQVGTSDSQTELEVKDLTNNTTLRGRFGDYYLRISGAADNNFREAFGQTGVVRLTGTGTPEGARTAPVGSIFIRTDGGVGTTFYVKESGTGNTGWVAK